MASKILLAAVLIYIQTEAICYFTVKDVFLTEKTSLSVSGPDWLSCIQMCVEKPNCLSYVYDKRSRTCYIFACGFGGRCRASKTLRTAPGKIFQQIRQLKNDTENCITDKNSGSSEISDLKDTFATYGRLTVYGDGRFLGNVSGNSSAYAMLKLSIPTEVQVIAIDIDDSLSRFGVLSSFENGLVSNEKWKCISSKEQHSIWAKATFNDTGWPRAHLYADNIETRDPAGVYHWKHVKEISPRANWIWTESDADSRIVCRVKL